MSDLPFSESDGGQVPAITTPTTSGVNTSTSGSGPLGSIGDALKEISTDLTAAQQGKNQAGGIISQLEQLTGIHPAPAQQAAQDQGQSILQMVAIGAVLLLGAVLVYKLVIR